MLSFLQSCTIIKSVYECNNGTYIAELIDDANEELVNIMENIIMEEYNMTPTYSLKKLNQLFIR